MGNQDISPLKRWMAERCLTCLVCSRAREKQKGFSYWLVKNVETKTCPFCRAYEQVYGRKAHEPVVDPERTA